MYIYSFTLMHSEQGSPTLDDAILMGRMPDSAFNGNSPTSTSSKNNDVSLMELMVGVILKFTVVCSLHCKI